RTASRSPARATTTPSWSTTSAARRSRRTSSPTSSPSRRRSSCNRPRAPRSARRRASPSADVVAVTFFEHQTRARRSTSLLVVLFALAVVGVVLAVNLVVPLALYVGARGFFTPSPGLYVTLTVVTLAVIGIRTLVGVLQMRGCGDAVAQLAGGVRVERGTRDADERRLLNVVDEMAIASGVSVPHVYVLRGERGINAFAAGYSPNEAVVAVTEGTARTLTRDELQGVVAHEFSHVLNGDMRLSVQMIGVLAGILFIGEVGNFLLRARSGGDDRRSGGGIVFVGAALLIIGYAGLFFGRLIKAAVSRQREFLADASSVQFTRNPEGIAGALATISAGPGSSLVANRRAETLSHMFFATGVSMWFESLFATHPPLLERIARIDRRFNPIEYLKRRRPRAAEPPETVAPVAPTRSRDRRAGWPSRRGCPWWRSRGRRCAASTRPRARRWRASCRCSSRRITGSRWRSRCC